MRSPAPIAKDVLRLRAPNPSPLTGTGTNCYLIFGEGGAVLIDAGPAIGQHMDAVMGALGKTQLHAILITHPHLDHSEAAPLLAQQTGAQILSFGAAQKWDASAQNGTDAAHIPDHAIQDGDEIALAGLRLTAIHTPGHMQGHLCYGFRDMLFSGDHVMGWASSTVAPPEGRMADYRASLGKLQGRGYRRYWPGHGEAIQDPEARLAALIAHRDHRETQILAALEHGPAAATQIAAQIYSDTPPQLLPAAATNVLAHLIELADLGRIQGPIMPDVRSVFSRIDPCA